MVVRTLVLLAVTAVPALAQNAVVLTGDSKKKSCRAALTAPGITFPGGKRARGVTCADGAACDRDGVVNGVCQLAVQVCVNVPSDTCSTTTVSQVDLKAVGKSSKDATLKTQLQALEAAAAAIPLPASAFGCSAPVDVSVAVKGPNKKGTLAQGTAQIQVKVVPKTKGKVALVCRPGGDGPPASTTTTTTLPPPPSGSPENGLRAEILAAAVDASRMVHVTFQLTDDAGFPVTPVLGSTTDPDEARIRLTLARLDLDSTTQEGLTTTFTRYRNYITSPQTSPITSVTANLPAYDSSGTLTAVDLVAGTWRYTFSKPLPEGYDASLTHTVGGQVERTIGETRLVANPLFDFVPAGGAVTTVREVVTTGQCNSCHNPLEAHGGARREVKLCQLCHTDQAPDPDTGNSIALLDMVHRIHRGRDLPSIVDGAVGAKYEIVGFQQARHVFGEKIKACAGGAFNGITCGNDADCGSAGTCTGTATVGVSFPRDIRACDSCHGQGATAADYREKASTAACASCHDDVNPGESKTSNGDPGEGHQAGAQPDTLCRVCHGPTGQEFDITVPGAHTMPLRSSAVPGLAAELLTAAGDMNTPITVTFRLTDGAGTVLTTVEGLDAVRFNASGPTTDFGATTPPIVSGTAQASSGETGVLTGPDGAGVFTYEFGTLPAGATGTWRVGIEARGAQVTAPNGESVRATAQNAVLDFGIGGSPVVPRRTITSNAKCGACHGTFGVDFSIHGGLRTNVEYCGICHHPRSTDFTSRSTQIANGADPDSESIHLKVLAHKLHTGEELDQTLYIVYGRQGRPVDLGEVRFPGDRRDCATCHENDSQLLPLPAGLLPTRLTTNVSGTETLVEDRPPVTAACLTCHGSDSALAHARANTFGGTETCQVCHGEGRVVPVSEVHARAE
jgi:hypothetical protein